MPKEYFSKDFKSAQSWLSTLAQIMEVVFYSAAILTIAWGGITAIVLLIQSEDVFDTSINKFSNDPKHVMRMSQSRIVMGETLNMALTFILAADIIRTIRSPDYYQLGKLVILVLLRQFIIYFLNREIAGLKQTLKKIKKPVVTLPPKQHVQAPLYPRPRLPNKSRSDGPNILRDKGVMVAF